MFSTITIRKTYAMIAIAASVGTLIGLLLGWVIFSRPASSPTSVPPAALEVAYKAGSAILMGTTPDNLPMDVFTESFLYRYQAEYAAVTRPMSTTEITWTGAPVVTWVGMNFIDICLIAHTQAGTLAIEMRLARSGNTWAVDQLLSLQLREAK